MSVHCHKPVCMCAFVCVCICVFLVVINTYVCVCVCSGKRLCIVVINDLAKEKPWQIFSLFAVHSYRCFPICLSVHREIKLVFT